jgi:hypothetical protein
MEAMHMDSIRDGDGPSRPSKDLGRAIHERFAAIGGFELELPPRGPMREPPRFEWTRDREGDASGG